MSGIYIHIPFCKSRCIYCGFFSTTSLQRRKEYVRAVCRELELRKGYIDAGNSSVATIYFGGGTPSQLEADDIREILSAIYNIYNVRDDAEITLEGNPDDLSEDYLRELRSVGVNRLSIGVQTFSDDRLRFLRRRHSAEQAVKAVESAKRVGFDNISLDLMFGFPSQSLGEWTSDVDKALSLGVQHLSAYSLMYEDGTHLSSLLDRGEIAEVPEEVSLSMFEYLIDATSAAGFEHYEISNFSLHGKRSRHNSSYWHGVPYLGVGAGAHSYDGRSRQYNPDSLQEYLSGIQNGRDVAVMETLSAAERYDEYVFTALRTSDGLSLPDLAGKFGKERRDYCLKMAHRHQLSGKLVLDGELLRLSRSGLFVSNDIMSDLMLVEE